MPQVLLLHTVIMNILEGIASRLNTLEYKQSSCSKIILIFISDESEPEHNLCVCVFFDMNQLRMLHLQGNRLEGNLTIKVKPEKYNTSSFVADCGYPSIFDQAFNPLKSEEMLKL